MTARDPASLVQGQTAGGHQTMEVRMSQQFLIPGVQDRQKAEPCPEMLRIGRDGQQGLRSGTEQKAVHHAGVLQRGGNQLMRQGKDHMAVRNR